MVMRKMVLGGCRCRASATPRPGPNTTRLLVFPCAFRVVLLVTFCLLSFWFGDARLCKPFGESKSSVLLQSKP